MEQTIQCHICLEPYKFYSYYAGDQSACPDCVNKANKNMKSRYDDETSWYGKVWEKWNKKND